MNLWIDLIQIDGRKGRTKFRNKIKNEEIMIALIYTKKNISKKLHVSTNKEILIYQK